MQTIKINETEYPIRFGMREVQLFAKVAVKEGETTTIDAAALFNVYHSALVKGGKVDGKPFGHDAEWLELQIDEDPELLDAFEKSFEQSKMSKYLSSKDESGKAKKKK